MNKPQAKYYLFVRFHDESPQDQVVNSINPTLGLTAQGVVLKQRTSGLFESRIL